MAAGAGWVEGARSGCGAVCAGAGVGVLAGAWGRSLECSMYGDEAARGAAPIPAPIPSVEVVGAGAPEEKVGWAEGADPVERAEGALAAEPVRAS